MKIVGVTCYIYGMNTVTLTYKIAIKAKQSIVFDYVSDWEKQSNWIMFTTVKIVSNSQRPQDTELLATTKIGPLKLADTMVITEWEPHMKIVVEHTGRVILGKGVFNVKEISDDETEFLWQEITPIPFGQLGKIGFFIVKPILNTMFGMSLKRLKRNIEK